MRILILGTSGRLGYSLYTKLKTDNIIFHTGLKKRKKNLLLRKNIQKLILITNPNLIINCLAETNIEKCEKIKKQTKKINIDLIKNIFVLKTKKKLKFNFIHFSTDQMYNNKLNAWGKESDKPIILNEYTKQKIISEKIALKNNSLIFRTNFFGKSKKKNTFSDWIYNSFLSKKKIYLFSDIVFNPLRIDTVCNVIKFIIKRNKFGIKGIFNLGSKTSLSKLEFAIKFAKLSRVLNKNYVALEACKQLKVKRPKNMIMDINKFEKTFKIFLPTLEKEISIEAQKYNKK